MFISVLMSKKNVKMIAYPVTIIVEHLLFFVTWT